MSPIIKDERVIAGRFSVEDFSIMLTCLRDFHRAESARYGQAHRLIERGNNNPERARELRALEMTHSAWENGLRLLDEHLHGKSTAAVCRECNQPLDQVADCTCIVRPAPKPLRKQRVKGGVH